MTDDIVARLRQTHRVGCECFGCDAADEIERLRAERDEARRMYLDEMCLREYGDVRARIEEAGARGWSSLFADEGKHERDA